MSKTPNLYFIITFLVGIAVIAKSVLSESKGFELQIAGNYFMLESFLFELLLGIILTVKSGVLLLLKKGLKRNLFHLLNIILDILALLMLEAGLNMTVIPRRYYSFDTFSTFSMAESNISYLKSCGTWIFCISQILSVLIIITVISRNENMESLEILDDKINDA